MFSCLLTNYFSPADTFSSAGCLFFFPSVYMHTRSVRMHTCVVCSSPHLCISWEEEGGGIYVNTMCVCSCVCVPAVCGCALRVFDVFRFCHQLGQILCLGLINGLPPAPRAELQPVFSCSFVHWAARKQCPSHTYPRSPLSPQQVFRCL